MPPGSRDEIASTESGLDRISALPNEAIHHILGFLPAKEAGRTSVLARGWRHHWRSMHSLHISDNLGGVLSFWFRLSRLRRLMEHVLLNRQVPLDECHINIEEFYELDDAEADRWIRHAVSECHVRVLVVDIDTEFDSKMELSGKPMVSRHLKRLELHSVRVEDEVLDLSGCTALEDLRLSSCAIGATKISSRSVKRLMIAACMFYRRDCRTCISTPNVVSLKLDNNFDTTPLLDSMPLLETAFVRLFYDYPSICKKSDNYEHFCGVCENCSANYDHNDGCMLLGGLSSVTQLELISPIAKFTNWKCPTFDKLKTLLLNEWCVTIDLGALMSILQHSPCLEKLTLQLKEGPKQTMLLEESYNTEKPPGISKLLNVVEIKCMEVDKRVHEIIKMLSTFDLQINITRTRRPSNYFSFEKFEDLD